jgi:tetratricopeptide (TPR) repeat protein
MIHNNRGSCYAEMDDHENALNDYTAAVNWDDCCLHRCNRASVHLAQGKLEDARFDCDKALEFDPNDESALDLLEQICPDESSLDRGIELFETGSWHDAMQSFFAAAKVVTSSRTTMAQLMSVTCCMRLETYDAALVVLDKYIEQYPSDPSGLLSRSVVHRRIGNVTESNMDEIKAMDVATTVEAAKAYQQTVSEMPGQEDITLEEAMDVYENLMLANVTNPDKFEDRFGRTMDEVRQAYMCVAALNLGDSMRNLRQTEAAIVAYTLALRKGVGGLQSDAITAHRERGHCYLELGQMEEALEDLTCCVKREANNPKTLYARAAIYVKLCRWAEADADLTKALKLNGAIDTGKLKSLVAKELEACTSAADKAAAELLAEIESEETQMQKKREKKKKQKQKKKQQAAVRKQPLQVIAPEKVKVMSVSESESDSESELESASPSDSDSDPDLTMEADVTPNGSPPKVSYDVMDTICPLTLEMMRDPVFDGLGFTYEREAITKWLEDHNTSPSSGQILPHKELTADAHMAKFIRDMATKTQNLSAVSPLVRRRQPGNGTTRGIMDAAGFTRTTQMQPTEELPLSVFFRKWKLDFGARQMMQRLPPAVQSEVVANFKPGHGTANVSGRLVVYARAVGEGYEARAKSRANAHREDDVSGIIETATDAGKSSRSWQPSVAIERVHSFERIRQEESTRADPAKYKVLNAPSNTENAVATATMTVSPSAPLDLVRFCRGHQAAWEQWLREQRTTIGSRASTRNAALHDPSTRKAFWSYQQRKQSSDISGTVPEALKTALGHELAHSRVAPTALPSARIDEPEPQNSGLATGKSHELLDIDERACYRLGELIAQRSREGKLTRISALAGGLSTDGLQDIRPALLDPKYGGTLKGFLLHHNSIFRMTQKAHVAHDLVVELRDGPAKASPPKVGPNMQIANQGARAVAVIVEHFHKSGIAKREVIVSSLISELAKTKQAKYNSTVKPAIKATGKNTLDWLRAQPEFEIRMQLGGEKSFIRLRQSMLGKATTTGPAASVEQKLALGTSGTPIAKFAEQAATKNAVSSSNMVTSDSRSKNAARAAGTDDAMRAAAVACIRQIFDQQAKQQVVVSSLISELAKTRPAVYNKTVKPAIKASGKSTLEWLRGQPEFEVESQLGGARCMLSLRAAPRAVSASVPQLPQSPSMLTARDDDDDERVEAVMTAMLEGKPGQSERLNILVAGLGKLHGQLKDAVMPTGRNLAVRWFQDRPGKFVIRPTSLADGNYTVSLAPRSTPPQPGSRSADTTSRDTTPSPPAAHQWLQQPEQPAPVAVPPGQGFRQRSWPPLGSVHPAAAGAVADGTGPDTSGHIILAVPEASGGLREQMIDSLVDMGFRRERAAAAVDSNSGAGGVDAAVNFLLSNFDAGAFDDNGLSTGGAFGGSAQQRQQPADREQLEHQQSQEFNQEFNHARQQQPLSLPPPPPLLQQQPPQHGAAGVGAVSASTAAQQQMWQSQPQLQDEFAFHADPDVLAFLKQVI